MVPCATMARSVSRFTLTLYLPNPIQWLISYTAQIDFEKLATLAGMKKTSAHTNYWRAKKHLEQILNANPVSPTQIARPQPEGGDADSPKAVRSGKRGAAKDGSIKKTEPAKRRKTDTKTVSELVESTQTEDTAETTPADTTDQAE